MEAYDANVITAIQDSRPLLAWFASTFSRVAMSELAVQARRARIMLHDDEWPF